MTNTGGCDVLRTVYHGKTVSNGLNKVMTRLPDMIMPRLQWASSWQIWSANCGFFFASECDWALDYDFVPGEMSLVQ